MGERTTEITTTTVCHQVQNISLQWASNDFLETGWGYRILTQISHTTRLRPGTALGPTWESKAWPWCNYLNELADDPIEEAHQLTAGQFYLFFQHIHGFVLQTNPQKKGLEDKIFISFLNPQKLGSPPPPWMLPSKLLVQQNNTKHNRWRGSEFCMMYWNSPKLLHSWWASLHV